MSESLSRVFSALSDPTRRQILQRLGEQSATVGELARPFPISLPAISRHLKVLEAAGLITRDRDAQWRRASLRGESIREAMTWLGQLNQVWGAATRPPRRPPRRDEAPPAGVARDPGNSYRQGTELMNDPTYEVCISRYFDAPPEMVYRAFVDPAQLAQWFGPLVFHVPASTVDIDARPGGHWRMTMVNNDDPQWQSPISSTFVEVVENRLLVGYELAQGFPGIEDGTKLSLSLEFLPDGDGTRLELRQGPFPEQLRTMSETGWGQSFFKLDGLLATPEEFRPSTT
ncbi:MAG TPA: metalloregulator ArsR/SmtB family transcription factor [Candidatus Lustribacter sp.]|nr:metalloregulator ArsR/SmtB family transcription factor [Candidatus Lustribacter sp.]